MPRFLLAILALAAAGSCINSAPSVTISRICAPTEDCIFGATCDLQTLGTPTVNAVASGPSNALVIFVEIQNQLPNNADPSAGRVNTNNFHVEEARVEVETSVGTATLVNPMQQLVPAAGTAVLGVGLLPAADYSQLLVNGATSALLTARLKLKGVLDDGSSFESAEFKIPVAICDNCIPANAACTAPAVRQYCPASGRDISPRNSTCL